MNSPSDVPQPIPYQGSKRQLAPTILLHFPNEIQRLVEPFAGSAALSIAVASRHSQTQFWINDAHRPLIDLWKQIIFHPDELSQSYEQLWLAQNGQERSFFNEVRDTFNKTGKPADFLYLLARSVKAAIRYNSYGQFNNTPDNRRKGAKPEEMRRRISNASYLFEKRTRLTAWDYTKVLSACTNDDLIYMDPPYQGVCGNRDQRYLPKIEHDEFCNQLKVLVKRDIMFAISYDGRTGTKTYGKPLPKSLGLKHLEIKAGRSSQATLLGRTEITYESLYLSPALIEAQAQCKRQKERQLSLW